MALNKYTYNGYVIHSDGTIDKKRGTGKIKPWVNTEGYCQITMYIDGKAKHIQWHRLIAKYFVPNPNDHPVVNHLDGNKQNNHPDNLEWCTSSENSLHAVATGLLVACKGEDVGTAKVSNLHAQEIRDRYKAGGITQTLLAKEYGIGQTQVSNIVNNVRKY